MEQEGQMGGADGTGTEEAGDDRQGTGQHHRARSTGRGGHRRGGANRALTVPLFKAVLTNCYLVLGLKDRTPKSGLRPAPTQPSSL